MYKNPKTFSALLKGLCKMELYLTPFHSSRYDCKSHYSITELLTKHESMSKRVLRQTALMLAGACCWLPVPFRISPTMVSRHHCLHLPTHKHAPMHTCKGLGWLSAKQLVFAFASSCRMHSSTSLDAVSWLLWEQFSRRASMQATVNHWECFDHSRE